MSENIRGITFAEQTVTPADDAIVRRAMLSDGILSGCNITYSGSTLTMAAGYVIACGRIFQITAAQNWAVADATSGVARLVLTIDLTKTATETAFDQISFSIEYASAENGFVNLTQDDINIAGVRYQVAVAVVSLGAGGITGILSKLERAEGGGGLNFKVVPGLTQPGSATLNTIWVMTEKMSGWIFSATEPETPEEGMVWISTGTSSTVAFNALKKNVLQVYPIAAKQYVNGAWVDVTAMSYQGGEWVGWIIRLYDNGDECESITGGWVINNAANGATSKKDTYIEGSYSKADNGHSIVRTAEKLKFPYGNAKTLKILLDVTSQMNANSYPSRFGLYTSDTVTSGGATNFAYNATCSTVGNNITFSLDISSASGDFYVAWLNVGVGKMYDVWFE